MRQVRISTVLVLVTTWAEKKLLVEEKNKHGDVIMASAVVGAWGFMSNFLV